MKYINPWKRRQVLTALKPPISNSLCHRLSSHQLKQRLQHPKTMITSSWSLCSTNLSWPPPPPVRQTPPHRQCLCYLPSLTFGTKLRHRGNNLLATGLADFGCHIPACSLLLKLSQSFCYQSCLDGLQTGSHFLACIVMQQQERLVGFVSATRPLGSPRSRSEFLDSTVGQMNNMIQSVATAAGQFLALTTADLHHVWLGLTAVPRLDRDDLLGAPILAQGLFGSISTVTQCLKRLERSPRCSAVICCSLTSGKETMR